MLPEEIKFNEARKEFDDSYSVVKEAIDFYNRTWPEYLRKERGITDEGYFKLIQLEKLIQEMVPERGVIFTRNSNNSTKTSEATSSELVVSEEINSFFSRITQSIKKIFNRIMNVREEANNNEEIDSSKQNISGSNIVFGLDDIQTPEEQETTYYNIDEMIETCTRNLEELIRRSNELDVVYEKKINDVPSGNVIDEKRDGPGILDDYRQASWGIERICLDGFQNHLPADSKGTQCYLHFKVGNKWVNCETAKLHRNKIKEVRFSDNGVGFTADNLFYLHSTKTSEDTSAGQFGEGMKLASIAAVNLGLGLEFQSRNWTAIATSEDKKIINTRHNDAEESRKKLVYDVKTYDGEPIIGSRTIFHTPTPEFIDYALQLPEKILHLGDKKPIFSSKGVDIIDLDNGGNTFVKGIFLTKMNLFFSYNFNDADVNPDRNGFHQYDPNHNIYVMLSKLDNVDLIEKFLTKLIDYIEENKLAQNKYYYWDDHPKELGAAGTIAYTLPRTGTEEREKVNALWSKAFERVFEHKGFVDEAGNPKKPILKTDYEVPDYLKGTLDNYVLVEVLPDWINAFKALGIQTDRDIIPEYIEEKVPTSLSLDYGNQIWNEQRIVLDACQNHLPSDSKGTTIFLRFQTTDGCWHDYREFDKFDDSEIAKIKISDDGIGYDSKNLGLFASVKDHSDSSGKWGEGLKMLSAAAVRNGIQLELRSRDWIATPETQTEILNEGQANEKTIERLVYNIKKKVDPLSKVLDDGDNTTISDYGFVKDKEVSSTTFLNPTPELIREFRNIKDSVLLFSPRTPLTTVGNSEILSTTGGQLFVRNILIPGNHQLKYTYHLKDFDIETRDRDVIKRESMQKMMKRILENVEDERFISEFLSGAVAYAQEHGRESFLEFETQFNIPAETDLADKWIKVFKHKFGERTSIRLVGDTDFNAYHQAQHLGLDMITLPNAVASSLIGLRGKDGLQISSYEQSLEEAIKNALPLNEDELTEHEKRMVEHLYNYNKILGLSGGNQIQQIKVYEYPVGYIGERAGGFAGKGNTINISRDTLNNGIIEAGDVFFHEADHAITGAKDAEAAFRDYLSGLLSCVAARVFPLQESIEDNGVAEDVSISDINKSLDMLKLVFAKAIQDNGKLNTGEEFGK